MYAWRSPQWIRGSHGPDQLPDVRTYSRPGPFGCDNLHQYRLKRLRCQEITVSGRTTIRADFQFAQIVRKLIQNRRSHRCNLGRLTCRLNEHLLAESGIFQRDLFMTAEHENDEPNSDQDCIQHQRQMC
jgi:hypothetical protein